MEGDEAGRYGKLSLISSTSEVITSFGIDTAPLTFGSDPKSTVRLFYPAIAPTHAFIEFVALKAYLVVQGKTGLEMDGCKLREGERVVLGNGDEFVIQNKRFRFDYPPKEKRQLMDPASPVKKTSRRVRLSMVRAAVIDSPTPGGHIVHLGQGEIMLREYANQGDFDRHDSPFASPVKSSPLKPSFTTAKEMPAPVPLSPSKSSIYPSLPLEPPPQVYQSPFRPPSPQKESLRGRVLFRQAMLAEEEQDEMEVAGGLFSPSDSESDRSFSDGSSDRSLEMVVDSEADAEAVPESEVEMSGSEPDRVEDGPSSQTATPRPRPSLLAPRHSVGGPARRPARPSFKIDYSIADNEAPSVPIKEEEPAQASGALSTPLRKRLSDDEKKALKERRKSALNSPDPFFAGRIPGLRDSPEKMIAVKEEVNDLALRSGSPFTRAPETHRPVSIFGQPRPNPFGPTIDLTEEEDEDDPQILMHKMQQTMQTMRARMSTSPQKDRATVEISPADIPMDVEEDVPMASSVPKSPSKLSAPLLSEDQIMRSPSREPLALRSPSPPRARSSSPQKGRSRSPIKEQETIPTVDLRSLLSSPKKTRTMSPAPAPPPAPAADLTPDVEMGNDEIIPGNLPEAQPEAEIVEETGETEEAEEEETGEAEDTPEEPKPASKPTSRTRRPPAAVEEVATRRSLRPKKAAEPAVDEPEAGPSKTTTRAAAKRTPAPAAATRGKRAPTPTNDGPRTRTRTKTDSEAENEEPPPKATVVRRTRSKTEPEASDTDDGKPKAKRVTRARTKTDPIPEETPEVVEVKTTRSTRAKKPVAVKEEAQESSIPRPRTRTRTRT
ncbi:hypothetical protein CYLTODRAFT_417978 [Cylindrobasidium torrendii FP15055 ss-10]|uniref:FHA domain-containing protein n=1 Tax=Cylindrobasidium torrendii FP15055 ss-10 TaxID=1314674 RepID=A0A0D7BS05_9AGAR|nr:hypothetical protein CYLTODRAFT_417978 [Cylindrobasidium torrendii FP15055 ss-10]